MGKRTMTNDLQDRSSIQRGMTEVNKTREGERAHSSWMLSLVCNVSILLTSREKLKSISEGTQGTYEFGCECHKGNGDYQ